MMTNIFNHLNPQQKQAVIYNEGPSLVIAGAGSGKTRVLVYKVLYLVKEKKVPPESIVMITFTNKAAEEMKKRVKLRLGFIGTFHSWCAWILRRDGFHIGINNNFLIFDEDDQLKLIKKVLEKINKNGYQAKYFLNRILLAKNQLITPENYLKFFSDYNAQLTANVYSSYQNALKKNNGLDFDDLLMKTTELFIKKPIILSKYQDIYRYLLIDEFQDTNYAQYILTKLIGEKFRKVMAVGDFSQSIYSWRGADIGNFEKFKQDFPEVKFFYLEENYRSTQKILDFAYEVISKNQTHPVLHLFTKNISGEEIEQYEAENEQYEAIYVAEKAKEILKTNPPSSVAILYRTNAQSRIIEESFLHYGIPYILIGGPRFYERKEIKDIISYLRLILNPSDEVAAERIKKLGKDRFKKFIQWQKKSKNIWQKTTNEIIEEIFQVTNYLKIYHPEDEEDWGRIENIKELKSVAMKFPKLTDFLDQVSLVESEYFQGEKNIKKKNGVRLMTLHQAKGLEFPYVFIIGLEEGLLPHSRSFDNLFQIEEERRLFYVGITRAKYKLFLTYARKRFIFGRRGEMNKSRFLSEENNLNYI